MNRDHLGLAVGESLCLQYVVHGKPVSDAAVLIGHHSEFAVLDEVTDEINPARPKPSGAVVKPSRVSVR